MSLGTAILSLPLLVFIASSCDCPTSVEPGLRLTVVDDATGQPAAFGATTTAVRGGAIDTLELIVFTDSAAAGYFEGWVGEGTYSVRVTKPGYQLWQRDNVRVRRERCGIAGVELSARLVQ